MKAPLEYEVVPAGVMVPMSASDQPVGSAVTENAALFDDWLLTVTSIGPELAPEGTANSIAVLDQPKAVCGVPSRVTVLLACEFVKFVPTIVTTVPTIPDEGDRLKMPGPEVTVKSVPLLGTAETVTTTLPVVALKGTGTTMPVAVHAVGVAEIPPKVTVLDP